MPKFIVAVTIVVLLGGMFTANAQTTRGAAGIQAASHNFTPIVKAACGPFWGRYCGPFHHWVCRHRRCWCAPC
jgi:hypothetical protein